MKLSFLFLLAATFACGSTAPFAAEPLPHELLVFGSGELTKTSDVDTPVDIDEFRVAADILFSVQRGRLKLFGEYLLANHEQDLERFQVGWEPNEHSVIWLGRFHQASSVWNHQHHHGQFLQTSITRPAAEEWEDEGGVIPQHFVGLLSEAGWRVGARSGMRMAVGGGIAPVLTPEGLEAFDLLSPDTRRHKLGFQARIAWLPDELEENGIGLLFAHNEIATRSPASEPPPDFDHVDQTVIGAYAKLESGDWKLHAAVYDIDAVLVRPGSDGSGEDFYTGYLQVERSLSHGLDAYARYEGTGSTENAEFLRLFPHFVTQRLLVGVRWQFARKHAFTLQTGNSHTSSDRYREFRLQWSAALL